MASITRDQTRYLLNSHWLENRASGDIKSIQINALPENKVEELIEIYAQIAKSANECAKYLERLQEENQND